MKNHPLIYQIFLPLNVEQKLQTDPNAATPKPVLILFFGLMESKMSYVSLKFLHILL